MDDTARALERLKHAGDSLSNCAFNLAQRSPLDDPTRDTLDKCRREWDDARIELRAANWLNENAPQRKAINAILDSIPIHGAVNDGVPRTEREEGWNEAVDWIVDEFEAALAATPAQAEPDLKHLTYRLQHAIEGECGGLAIDWKTASSILRYVLADTSVHPAQPEPARPAKEAP